MGIDELKLRSCKYSEIKSKLIESRKREFEDEVIEQKIKICEEIIEYSLYLYASTNDIVNLSPTGERVNEKDTWVSEMYERNFLYLISSYELGRSGLINSANVLLRSIFEVVCHIYFMHLTTDEELQLFLRNELCKQNPLSKAELKVIRSNYKFFSPGFVRGLLYENSKRVSMDNIYSDMSKRAHASVTSAKSSFTSDPDMLDDTLCGILSLGIANVVAYWEVWFDTLNKNNINKFDFLLEKMHKELNMIPFDIIPNKPDMLTKIHFKSLESIEKSE